jgi:hypothetical protein
LIYVLLLLVVTAVLGWTFVLVKGAVTQYPTLPFLQIRFALPLPVMAAVVRRRPALPLVAILGHEVASLKFERHVQPSTP